MYLTQEETNALKESLYENVDYNRHGLFILIMALIWLFDRSDEKTEEEITQEIIDRTIAMINRTQATELCSVATLTVNINLIYIYINIIIIIIIMIITNNNIME